MNLFPPISKCNYNGINKQIYDALTEKAIESCQGAATETKKSLDCCADDYIQTCQVSVDGSWKKRGPASLNGVVTMISKTESARILLSCQKSAKAANFGREKQMNLDMLLGLQTMNVRVIMIGHLELWTVQVQLYYSRDQLNDIN